MVERLVDVLDSRGNLRHVLPIRIEGSRNSNLLYEMKAFGLVVGFSNLRNSYPYRAEMMDNIMVQSVPAASSFRLLSA